VERYVEVKELNNEWTLYQDCNGFMLTPAGVDIGVLDAEKKAFVVRAHYSPGNYICVRYVEIKDQQNK